MKRTNLYFVALALGSMAFSGDAFAADKAAPACAQQRLAPVQRSGSDEGNEW